MSPTPDLPQDSPLDPPSDPSRARLPGVSGPAGVFGPREDEAFEAQVAHVVSAIMQLRVADLLDPPPLVEMGVALVQRGGLAWVLTQLVRPLRRQLLADLRTDASERLGELVPEAVKSALAATIGRPLVLPDVVVEAVATSEFLGREIRVILQDALDAYMTRGPTGPGLRDAVGRGVRALGAARGLWAGLGGGLADEVKKQLRGKLSEFVDESFDLIQQRAARRLVQPEVRREMGREAAAGFLAVLEHTLAEATTALPDELIDTVESVLPLVLENLSQRQSWRDRAQRLAAGAQTQLRDETVGAMLDHLHVRAEVEAWLVRVTRMVLQA